MTVEVVRNPAISFNFDSASTWRADKFAAGTITSVIAYPSDTSQQAMLFNRLTLQPTGRDNAGNTLQLIINFDVANVSQLIGVYTPAYSTQRGLAGVQVYDRTNSNNLSVYSLCSGNIANASFQISRQNQSERIISGLFQMTLCNPRDSARQLKIVNGIFTDIRY